MIRIELFSKRHHLKQVLTGFHLFGIDKNEKIKIVDRSNEKQFDTIACMVYIYGKTIVYDMQDGYQDCEAMCQLLEKADVYFKRSYSKLENGKLENKLKSREDIRKMYPLGFNYNVTYDWSPLNMGTPWKEYIKRLIGYNKPADAYFKKEVFERAPDYQGGPPKIFFQTRLWDIPNDYPQWKKDQWQWINETRLTIVRALKKEFGSLFDGGLIDSEISRRVAPDYVLPSNLTDRRVYVDRMQESDICIGTTGLHMSIGGKTGEYIAASRAIVHEKFYYEVTGDFQKGKNYLEFTNADECIQAVYRLRNNPDLIRTMQHNNYVYYQKYLEPYQLIKNSLEVARNSVSR